MRIKNRLQRIVLAFYCGIFLVGFLNALEIRKEFDIDFDYEVAIFWIDEHLIAWDSKKAEILVFQNNSLNKSIKMNKGQGPGDFQVINSIFSTPDNILIWDRYLRRISSYSKDWRFIEIEQFHLLGMACPIGKLDNDYLFQWSDFNTDKKGSKVVRNVGLINKDKTNTALYHTAAYFNYHGKLNYDCPISVVSFSDPYLYYASNRDYTIYALDLRKKDSSPVKIIHKKNKSIKWGKKIADLQWQVIKKNSNLPESIYPKFVPPIFCLISSGDMVGIVTNELIEEKKAAIDIYRCNKFLGRLVIPMLYIQHYVFPSYFYFSDGILWDKEKLYTLHYESNSEKFKIIKWNIKY